MGLNKNMYSLLMPFVENYFNNENYTIKQLSKLKRDEIIKTSMFFFSYDSKNKNLYIQSTSENSKDYVVISFSEGIIKGNVRFFFKPDDDFNYFNNLEDYIYNSELLRNILVYTNLGVRGEINDNGVFSIVIDCDKDNFTAIDTPVISLFKNSVEFSTVFNLYKNKIITSKDRFLWVFISIMNFSLMKLQGANYKFSFTIKNLLIDDKDIYKIKRIDTKYLKGVEFINCKLNIVEPENIEFIKSISSMK